MYFDGHDRQDVLDYRDSWLARRQESEKYMPLYLQIKMHEAKDLLAHWILKVVKRWNVMRCSFLRLSSSVKTSKKLSMIQLLHNTLEVEGTSVILQSQISL